MSFPPLTVRYSEDSDDDDYTESGDTDSTQVRRHKRCLLSTSLDVDPRLPYRSELKGFPPGLDSHRIGIPKNTTAEDHQTILLTSMVMGMGEGREGKVRYEILRCRRYAPLKALHNLKHISHLVFSSSPGTPTPLPHQLY